MRYLILLLLILTACQPSKPEAVPSVIYPPGDTIFTENNVKVTFTVGPEQVRRGGVITATATLTNQAATPQRVVFYAPVRMGLFVWQPGPADALRPVAWQETLDGHARPPVAAEGEPVGGLWVEAALEPGQTTQYQFRLVVTAAEGSAAQVEGHIFDAASGNAAASLYRDVIVVGRQLLKGA